MTTSVMQTSFAGGELSKNLYARVDLEKYANGLALMRNFFVDYRGGASNRTGTRYIAACKSVVENEVRLVPFIFSNTQAYVLEFGDLYVRVYFQGTFILELATPYLGADIFDMKWVQSADVITLTHPAYPVYNLSRTAPLIFTLALQPIGPQLAPPVGVVALPTVVGTFVYGYQITALNSAGEESLPSDPVTCLSDPLDPTNVTPKVIAVGWGGAGTLYNIYKFGPVPDGQPLPTLFGYIGQTATGTFTDTNIGPDYARSPPTFRDPFSPGQLIQVDVSSGGTGYADYTPLIITGPGTGAAGYAVAQAGSITGAVITSTGMNYDGSTTVTIAGTGTGATFVGTVDLTAHYPAAVSYFQQRRVFGGASVSPELLEFSQIGQYGNFNISPAVLDSDAITVNIASREVDNIQSMVPMSTGLIVLTEGMAFLVTGDQPGAPISPSSISALPQAATGAGDLPPIVVNYNILFVQRQNSIVRDLAFNFGHQSYYGIDRSMLANHLFSEHTLVDWGWAEEPNKLLWAVRDDGRLLSMTYVPDQEVYGWARHDTQGLFKSVCVVPERDTDAAYVVVRRYIPQAAAADATGWVQYIERISERHGCCIFNARFVDAHVELDRAVQDQPLYLTFGPDGNVAGATVTFTLV